MKRLTILMVTFMLMFSLFSIVEGINLTEPIEYISISKNHADLPFEH